MKKWKRKERDDARDFGGRLVKGSGNQWDKPGDANSSTFLIDSKQTENKSFRVTKEIWDKLYEEALFAYKTPVLSIRMQDIDLVVLSKEDFLKVVKEELVP